MKITKNVAKEIIAQAAEMERQQREILIRRWANEGHLHVVEHRDNEYSMALSLQGEVFAEMMGGWPSVELTARLALAIAAGRSDNNENDEAANDNPRNANNFTWRRRNISHEIVYRGGKLEDWMGL